MYCSNCGQTQCYCCCRGCGSPWMNCQARCGRPPMFSQHEDRSNDPPVIIREVNNAIDYAIYAVVMFLVPILGFMGIQAALNTNEEMSIWGRIGLFIAGPIALVIAYFMWNDFRKK